MCSKTQNQYQQLEFSKTSIISQNHVIEERSIKYDDQFKNDTTEESQQDPGIELDNLRLEYYKYKILSQLKVDPEELNPDINITLRNELLTTIKQNFTKNSYFRHERRDSGIANLRHKRSLACNQVKSNKDACCLETFYVNFTDIGWDKWIIYPPGYNANYCRGQCDLSHSRYYHSTLLSKFSNVIGLCCSPKQMASLRLLYIDENNKVHQKSMPDMIVESCDCA